MNVPLKPMPAAEGRSVATPALTVAKPKIVRDQPVKPPAIMLVGDVGAGKSWSIISALRAGLRVCVLVTENTGVDSLIDACKLTNTSMDNLHWVRCTPNQQDWKTLIAQAQLTNNNGVGDLQEMKTGLDRFKYPAYLNLLRTCESFICNRTKENLGNVSTWGDDTLLALDSMSGLSEIASDHVCGHRPTMTQPEFGIVQKHIYTLMNTLTSLSCFFMATGHLEMEDDEVKSVRKLMVSTVGKKLAPKLPRIFSEVVLARQNTKGDYVWVTQDQRVITKVRALPKGEIAADFAKVIEIHKERKRIGDAEYLAAQEALAAQA
jgi:hypothetical protein